MAFTTNIEYCARLLNEGQLVAIPTETVYGLAGLITNSEALQNIFKIKGRPLFNPLIVHLYEKQQLHLYAHSIPDMAWRLADVFWPGALTLILPKSSLIPDQVTGGRETVGLRIPKHPLTLKLLKHLDAPIAAPSANPFMKISPTEATHVADYFGDGLTILDGGSCAVGLESTIIGFEDSEPVLYRLGGISKEEIEAVVGPLKQKIYKEENPEAPGMLGKHYAPNTPLIVTHDVEAQIKKRPDKRLGILTLEASPVTATVVMHLSTNGDLKEAASRLFSYLHQLDQHHLDMIIAQRMPDKGMGKSINDRLERASRR